jgi:MFS family permease
MRTARLLVPAFGIAQILAWGSSYYLPAILARPIADDTGWPLTWVVGGLSLGLLVAAVASPFIGRQINRRGGRFVLTIGAFLHCAGLLALAAAPNLPSFLIAWAIIGLAMGAGLYDAAFSVLGRLYGQKARALITAVTLFGALASTLCWPLSALFLESFGWRGTCLAYAVIHAAIVIPIYLAVLPRHGAADSSGEAAHDVEHAWQPGKGFALRFVLMAVTFTVASMISTIVSVHLMTIFDARGIVLAAAVALGAIIGPAQLVARGVEFVIAKHHHPIWTHVVSASFVAVGLSLLWTEAWPVALALAFYGAGIGLESIARATIPLALFAPRDYAPIMGRLARPVLAIQAISPSIGAFLVERLGSESMLGIVTAAAAANVGLAVAFLCLTGSLRGRRPTRPATSAAPAIPARHPQSPPQ